MLFVFSLYDSKQILSYLILDPIITRVHAPTKANSCTDYEQDAWNIAGYRAVTNSKIHVSLYSQNVKVLQNPKK